MSLLAWILVIVGVILAGVVTGVIVYRYAERVDDWEDATQHNINKIENQFAAAGVTGWFPEFLENLVVGDEEAVIRQVKQMMEAKDTDKFFLDSVAMPMALYAIRMTPEKYPADFAQLKAAVEKATPVAPATAPLNVVS